MQTASAAARRPDAAAQHDLYVLGDSFVWGYGVGQHDLLTNQAQRQLADWRVHNIGLIGAGTVQEYLLFEKYVAGRLRAGDAVVLAFFNNDFGDNIGLHSRGRLYATIDDGQVRIVPPQPDSTLRQWKNRMKDWSYLFNLVTYCVDCFQIKRNAKNVGDRVTRPKPTAQRSDPRLRRQPSGPHHAVYMSALGRGLPRKGGQVPLGLRARPG